MAYVVSKFNCTSSLSRSMLSVGAISRNLACWEMASSKIQTYQNKAKNLYAIYFVFDLDGECKFIKKNIIVIKQICSYLPPWLDKSEEILFTETWQPRTYFFIYAMSVCLCLSQVGVLLKRLNAKRRITQTTPHSF